MDFANIYGFLNCFVIKIAHSCDGKNLTPNQYPMSGDIYFGMLIVNTADVTGLIEYTLQDYFYSEDYSGSACTSYPYVYQISGLRYQETAVMTWDSYYAKMSSFFFLDVLEPDVTRFKFTVADPLDI